VYGWTRACTYHMGNQVNGVDVCDSSSPQQFTCGGRTLGDYAGETSIVTANIPNVGATFMPTWSQGAVAGNGFGSTIGASLVQVQP
jgi:hypothetical protein